MRTDTAHGYVVSYPTPTGFAVAEYLNYAGTPQWRSLGRRRYFRRVEDADRAYQRWIKEHGA